MIGDKWDIGRIIVNLKGYKLTRVHIYWLCNLYYSIKVLLTINIVFRFPRGQKWVEVPDRPPSCFNSSSDTIKHDLIGGWDTIWV